MQGLNSKREELELYIDSMQQKPNIVCITEHWLTGNESYFTSLDGYKLITAYTRKTLQKGGSCIFANVETESLDSIVKLNNEGNFECAGVMVRAEKIIIISIYRSTNGSVDIFLQQMEELLALIHRRHKNFRVIVCGDFNIHMHINNTQTKTFLDLMLAYNMLPTIFTPTRVQKQSATVIDNIFVNFDSYEDSLVLCTALSDHHGQLITFPIKTKINNSVRDKWVKKRVFSKNKLLQFKSELGQTDWEEILNATVVDVAYNKFISIITEKMDRIFVTKKYNVKNKSNAWITTGIRVSCGKKRELYRKKCAAMIPEWYYKKYCYILKKVIKLAKMWKNNEFLVNAENKSKATWSLIKSVTGAKNKSKEDLLKNFKSRCGNCTELLNMLNKYFIESCPDVNSNSVNSDFKINACQHSFFLYPTDLHEVYTCIRSLKNKQSVGADQVPICILKTVSEVIAYPLSHIINMSFKNGEFPEALKVAQIKPIHKKGDKSCEGNYRPISLLSNVSKVFEKLIHDRLLTFIEKNNILSSSQSGFRKGKSTVQAIYMAIEKILSALNTEMETVGMCIDLTKAFDSVHHQILCNKLEQYGIRGTPLSLMKSYLNNRVQYVIETDSAGDLLRSDPIVVKKGVPQGSILGPLLFILYINELPLISNYLMTLYADDVTVVIAEKNLDLLTNKTVDTLGLMSDYFKVNNLQLNIDKTQLIYFDNKYTELLNVNYNDCTLNTCNSIKFLGLYIDNRLDWKSHVDYLCSNLSKYCYALRTLTESVSTDVAVTAYRAYIHSRLSYGIIFWGNSVDIERVLILQKRCIRGIYKMAQTESCREIFVRNGIMTVISLYIYHAVIFVSENKEFFLDCVRTHGYDTRGKHNLVNEKYKYTYLQRNVKYSIIKIFNSLPENKRNITSSLLKKWLKHCLIQRPYYCLSEFFSDEYKFE